MEPTSGLFSGCSRKFLLLKLLTVKWESTHFFKLKLHGQSLGYRYFHQYLWRSLLNSFLVKWYHSNSGGKKLVYHKLFYFLSTLVFKFISDRSNSSPWNFQYDLWIGFWDFWLYFKDELTLVKKLLKRTDFSSLFFSKLSYVSDFTETGWRIDTDTLN